MRNAFLIIGVFSLHLIAVLGMPLRFDGHGEHPGTRGEQESSVERFPCEDCGCGCRTARQCWSGCCCFSVDERLAFARKHGIQPPPELLAQVSDGRKLSAVENDAKPTSESGCCHACCSTKHTSASDSDVRKPAATGVKNKKSLAAVSHRHRGPRRSWSILKAWECRGIHANVLSAGVPSFGRPLIWQRDPPEDHGRVVETSRSYASVSSTPDTPPPRRPFLALLS